LLSFHNVHFLFHYNAKLKPLHDNNNCPLATIITTEVMIYVSGYPGEKTYNASSAAVVGLRRNILAPWFIEDPHTMEAMPKHLVSYIMGGSQGKGSNLTPEITDQSFINKSLCPTCLKFYIIETLESINKSSERKVRRCTHSCFPLGDCIWCM